MAKKIAPKTTKKSPIPLVPFDVVPEMSMVLNGCKALLHYRDASGKVHEVTLDGVRSLVVKHANELKSKP